MNKLRLVIVLGFMLAALGGCRAKGPQPIVVENFSEFPKNDYVYTITPGDEIKVDVQQDENYAWSATVLPDGRAVFKYAGEIDVMGLTLRQLRDRLVTGLKDYYTSPNLTLRLLKAQGPDPIVFLGAWGGATTGFGTGAGGQTQRASAITYRKGIGLTEAIALAGGPTEPDIDIAPYVYVVRDIKSLKRTVYRFDLALAVRGGTPDLPLHPGDVVFIDNSWLQDLGRALGVVSSVVATASQGVSSALLVDVLSSRDFGR